MSSLTSTSPWMIDFEASQHITRDNGVFTSSQKYHGFEEISMGNCYKISISHTSTAVLHTPTDSVKLYTTLYSSNIKTNLQI